MKKPLVVLSIIITCFFAGIILLSFLKPFDYKINSVYAELVLDKSYPAICLEDWCANKTVVVSEYKYFFLNPLRITVFNKRYKPLFISITASGFDQVNKTLNPFEKAEIKLPGGLITKLIQVSADDKKVLYSDTNFTPDIIIDADKTYKQSYVLENEVIFVRSKPPELKLLPVSIVNNNNQQSISYSDAHNNKGLCLDAWCKLKVINYTKYFVRINDSLNISLFSHVVSPLTVNINISGYKPVSVRIPGLTEKNILLEPLDRFYQLELVRAEETVLYSDFISKKTNLSIDLSVNETNFTYQTNDFIEFEILDYDRQLYQQSNVLLVENNKLKLYVPESISGRLGVYLKKVVSCYFVWCNQDSAELHKVNFYADYIKIYLLSGFSDFKANISAYPAKSITTTIPYGVSEHKIPFDKSFGIELYDEYFVANKSYLVPYEFENARLFTIKVESDIINLEEQKKVFLYENK